jgi:hypothetical protein
LPAPATAPPPAPEMAQGPPPSSALRMLRSQWSPAPAARPPPAQQAARPQHGPTRRRSQPRLAGWETARTGGGAGPRGRPTGTATRPRWLAARRRRRRGARPRGVRPWRRWTGRGTRRRRTRPGLRPRERMIQTGQKVDYITKGIYVPEVLECDGGRAAWGTVRFKA